MASYMHVRNGKETIRGDSPYRNGAGWFALDSASMSGASFGLGAGRGRRRGLGAAWITLPLTVASHRLLGLAATGKLLDVVIDMAVEGEAAAYHVALPDSAFASVTIGDQQVLQISIDSEKPDVRQGPAPPR